MTCQVGQCDKPAHALGMCKIHYGDWRRHGESDVIAKLKRVAIPQRRQSGLSYLDSTGLTANSETQWE